MLERNANYSTLQIYAHSIVSLFPEKRKSTVVKRNIPPDFKFCLSNYKIFPIWCNVISKAAGREDRTHANVHPTEQPQHSNVIPIL